MKNIKKYHNKHWFVGGVSGGVWRAACRRIFWLLSNNICDIINFNV
jgi:hypothetical protein